MIYDGKERTAEEIAELLAEKDRLLKEKDDKIKKFEEGSTQTEEKTGEKTEEKTGEKTEEKTGEKIDPKLSEKKTEEKTDPKLSEKKEETKTMSESDSKILAETQEENKKLKERVGKIEQNGRSDKIELKLSAYENKGIPPVILDIAESFLLADKGEFKGYKFKEEGKEEKKISLSDAIYSLLDTVEGVSSAELSFSDTDGSSDISGKGEEKTEDKVKKYADEHEGMTFNEAYHKLLEKKEIEEIKVNIPIV